MALQQHKRTLGYNNQIEKEREKEMQSGNVTQLSTLCGQHDNQLYSMFDAAREKSAWKNWSADITMTIDMHQNWSRTQLNLLQSNGGEAMICK